MPFNLDDEKPPVIANGAVGELSPEGLFFILAEDSTIGIPLLVGGNEITGTTTIYAINTGLGSNSGCSLV